MNRITGNAPRSAKKREELFARRVGRLLGESAAALDDAGIAPRLAVARQAALRTHAEAFPADRVHVNGLWWARAGAAAAGGGGGDRRVGLARASLVFATAALVGACLVGIFQFEQRQRIEEQAEVEAALLADDLPISAYADHGFNAFVKQSQ